MQNLIEIIPQKPNSKWSWIIPVSVKLFSLQCIRLELFQLPLPQKDSQNQLKTL